MVVATLTYQSQETVLEYDTEGSPVALARELLDSAKELIFRKAGGELLHRGITVDDSDIKFEYAEQPKKPVRMADILKCSGVRLNVTCTLLPELSISSPAPAAPEARATDQYNSPSYATYLAAEQATAGAGTGSVSQLQFMRQQKNGASATNFRRRTVTDAELRAHASPDDAWTVYEGIVYDVSEYAKFHPGGARLLLNFAGKDCTTQYRKFHPWVNGHAILQNKAVGTYQPPPPTSRQYLLPE